MEWTCDLEMGAAQSVHELLLVLLEQFRLKGASLDTWAGDMNLAFVYEQDSCDDPTIFVAFVFDSAPGFVKIAGGTFGVQIKGRFFASSFTKFSVVVGQRFATQLLTLSRRKVTIGQAVPASQANQKGVSVKINLPAKVQE